MLASIDVALTKPQKLFALSTDKFPAIVGGLGSGKTRAGTMRLLLLMLADRGANGAYYLPTYDLITLRAIPGIEDDLIHLGLDYTVNKSSYTIQIHGFGDIIFRSYDRPERIIAYEVAHSICDELDTLPKEKASIVWRKINERNRQKRDTQNTIGLVTTPDQGVNGFVYEKWVKKQQPGYVLYKASTYSNPFLPKDYTDQILLNYDPVLAELYLNGEFVSLTDSKVYHYFNRQKHHTNRTITHNDQYLHIGQDFNIGACCSTVFVIDSGYPVIVDEFISHDTRDLCIQLSSRYPNKHISIYPDASGQSRHTNASESDIDILRAAGFAVMVNGMNPAIRDRINAFNGLLAHDKIKINTNICQNLTHALESAGYDAKGKPEKFDTHPSIDDWCFSADTKIIVNGSEILFKDIPENGFITGAFGKKVRFWNGGIKGFDSIYKITTNNGIILSTKDHEFLTLNGWVKAEYLLGETLCDVKMLKKKYKYLMVKNIKDIAQDILYIAGHIFIEIFGFIIMAIYRKVIVFTTKMKTKIITLLKTLKSCRVINTLACTWQNMVLNTRMNWLVDGAKGLKSLSYGIKQIVEKNFISNTMRILKSFCTKRNQEYVNIAARHTQEKIKEIQNIALHLVGIKQGSYQEFIVLLDHAVSVLLNLQLIKTIRELIALQSVEIKTQLSKQKNAQKKGFLIKEKQQSQSELLRKKFADIVRLSLFPINQLNSFVVTSVSVHTTTKEPVYCLTTDDGCFSLANGIIVSNCDSAGYCIAFKWPVAGIGGVSRLTGY